MLAVTAPVMLIMVAIGYATDDSDEPSADCRHADQIAHHFVSVAPGAISGLAGEADRDVTRKAAEAATAARAEAASIEDPDLRRKALAFADALQLFSQGNPSAPPNGWPDKNYMGGYQNSTKALHDLKLACPNVGTDQMPADVPTRTTPR
ncbi:hypothetical protein A5740_04950 [Mycobacterium sp. GA-1841]|nr:hypothetical protein A5740_04950 [Mycobacterium sp. GA-1841]